MGDENETAAEIAAKNGIPVIYSNVSGVPDEIEKALARSMRNRSYSVTSAMDGNSPRYYTTTQTNTSNPTFQKLSPEAEKAAVAALNAEREKLKKLREEIESDRESIRQEQINRLAGLVRHYEETIVKIHKIADENIQPEIVDLCKEVPTAEETRGALEYWRKRFVAADIAEQYGAPPAKPYYSSNPF